MKTRHINSFTGSMDVSAGYELNETRISYVKQFLNYMSTIWTSLSNLGVKEGQKPSEIKRIRLTNVAAIFGLILSIIELPVYIYLGAFTSTVSITITSIFMTGILILNWYSYYNTAKAFLFIIVDLLLIYSTGYMGKDAGIYLYFFSIIILPFNLFDLSEKTKLAFFTLLTFASVYIVEFSDLGIFSDPTITPEIKRFVYLSSLPGSFICVIFSVYSLVKENLFSERRLGESENLFKGLLDAAPDSTIITDNEGYITLCNKQVETIFGYETNELLGKHISVLVPSHLHSKTLKYFNTFNTEAQKRAGETPCDLFIARKDGTEVPVDLSRNSYLDKSGTMMIMVIRDITVRKKYEQELVQFSYVVSHDLKAPLRAIFKLSEWIEEELGPAVSGNLKNNLQFLRGRVFRLEALINGLLEYAKIGRANIKKEKVNTQVLISEVIEMLSPPPNITINVQQDMPIFETTKISLEQVFFNLLSNAIKYNDKEKGTITISAKAKNKFYEFSVEDNGIGIDPIYHEKIFVIFQTLEARDKVEGTGIGLAILKKSVEDMGGKIQLSSELGKGARFTFTWPQN